MSGPRLTWTPHEFQLPAAVLTARGIVHGRTGIVLALRDHDGAVGIGEAVPEPRFGTETLEELRNALTSLGSVDAVPVTVDELASWLTALNVSAHVHPTLSFALECCAASLIAQRHSLRLEQLLNPAAEATIAVNALITGDSAARQLARAQDAATEGHAVLKFKCAVGQVADEAGLLRRVHAELPAVRLRADANARWTLPEALDFCERVAELPLDYVEDPLAHAHPDSLRLITARTGVRLGLDESARDDVWRAARIGNKTYAALIVKPSIFGLTARLSALVTKARAAGMQIVVTSLYESSIGLAYAAAVAAAYGSADCAHGLATTPGPADTLEQPTTPVNGRLVVPDIRELAVGLRSDLRRRLEIE